MSRPSYVLKASCADTTGIVAAVTGFLARRDALIMELTHFVDEAAQKSFLRVEFEDEARNEADLAVLSEAFDEAVARYFGMGFTFHPTAVPMPTLLRASSSSSLWWPRCMCQGLPRSTAHSYMATTASGVQRRALEASESMRILSES